MSWCDVLEKCDALEKSAESAAEALDDVCFAMRECGRRCRQVPHECGERHGCIAAEVCAPLFPPAPALRALPRPVFFLLEGGNAREEASIGGVCVCSCVSSLMIPCAHRHPTIRVAAI